MKKVIDMSAQEAKKYFLKSTSYFSMNLPEYFGCNADALWDVLTGYIETPCEIVFIGFNKQENEYNKNLINRIISCFKDAEKEYPNKFKIVFS